MRGKPGLKSPCQAEMPFQGLVGRCCKSGSFLAGELARVRASGKQMSSLTGKPATVARVYRGLLYWPSMFQTGATMA